MKAIGENVRYLPKYNAALTRSTASSTQPPPAISHPPVKDKTRKFAIIGFISAIISLFILPEIFGPVAIILGAYTWRMEQGDSGNRGLIILILGIICMIVGIYLTAYLLISLLPY